MKLSTGHPNIKHKRDTTVNNHGRLWGLSQGAAAPTNKRQKKVLQQLIKDAEKAQDCMKDLTDYRFKTSLEDFAHAEDSLAATKRQGVAMAKRLQDSVRLEAELMEELKQQKTVFDAKKAQWIAQREEQQTLLSARKELDRTYVGQLKLHAQVSADFVKQQTALLDAEHMTVSMIGYAQREGIMKKKD